MCRTFSRDFAAGRHAGIGRSVGRFSEQKSSVILPVGILTSSISMVTGEVAQVMKLNRKKCGYLCHIEQMKNMTLCTLRIQSPSQMMIGVYNHLRNERYLGSITILSFGDWIPKSTLFWNSIYACIYIYIWHNIKINLFKLNSCVFMMVRTSVSNL